MLSAVTENEVISWFLTEYEPSMGRVPNLEAAIRDARFAVTPDETGNQALVLGLLGYLICVEMVGKYLQRDGCDNPPRTGPDAVSASKMFRLAMKQFGRRLPKRWDASNVLYSLRSSLAHEFSFSSIGLEDDDVSYSCLLTEDRPDMIQPADRTWDGALEHANELGTQTTVDVVQVAAYVEDLVVRLRHAHAEGKVHLANGITSIDLVRFGGFSIEV